jgi:hypothetical protein
MRALAEAIWLEAYYVQRRDLSVFRSLRIPVYETRAEVLELLLLNPTYPFRI